MSTLERLLRFLFCFIATTYKDIKPSISHFERILEKKYEAEKYIAFKSNRIISFRDKWKSYEELFLSGWLINQLIN